VLISNGGSFLGVPTGNASGGDSLSLRGFAQSFKLSTPAFTVRANMTTFTFILSFLGTGTFRFSRARLFAV
jgi:hypothetical protein